MMNLQNRLRPSSLLALTLAGGLALVGCADDPAEPEAASDGPAGTMRASSPSLAVGSDGMVLAAWESLGRIHFNVSEDGGETWNDPRELAIASPLAGAPAVTANGDHFEIAYQAYGTGETIAVLQQVHPTSKDEPLPPATVLDRSSLRKPSIYRGADGLYVAFPADGQNTRFAVVAEDAVQMGQPLGVQDAELCGADDGVVYAVGGGDAIRVQRLVGGGVEPVTELPMSDDVSTDGLTCAVIGDSLFVGVGTVANPPASVVANALRAIEINRFTGELVTETPHVLFESDELLIESPRVFARPDGSLGAVFYAGPAHDSDGELHLLRWTGAEIEEDVVATPRFDTFRGDIAVAVDGDAVHIFYEDVDRVRALVW